MPPKLGSEDDGTLNLPGVCRTGGWPAAEGQADQLRSEWCAPLLDVGGGSAAYDIELCRLHPGLTATVYEVPKVDDTLPGGHDTILLSMVLHEAPGANRAVIGRKP